MFERILGKVAKVCWLIPGFLLWAAFPPMAEKADALFALAPLIWLSRGGDSRLSARRWFLNGLVFWVATLSWMPAIVSNGGPWPLVALGWFALAAYCALYFGAYGYLSARFWRWAQGRSYVWRLFGLVVAEPVLWAGFELLRSRLFGGFSWNHLGVPLVNAGFGAPARIGGVYLCSAVALMINGTIASIAERMLLPLVKFRRERRLLRLDECEVEIRDGEDAEPEGSVELPPWARSIETFLPFALVFALYSLSERPAAAPDAERHLSAALVQRNFPCVFSQQPRDESPAEAYESLLANISLLRPDVVVLPESAFAEVGPLDSPGASRFAGWLRSKANARAVLAGGSRRDAGGRNYNSAALYGESRMQTYDKVHLIPFGEYIPFDKTITALQKLAPVGSCTPGELRTLDLGGVKVGVAICFEDTDSAQMRELAAMGAEVFAFITNDSWFSDSCEAEQHCWQSVARAVETGLPVLRAGNSGVTGVIRPDGERTFLVDSSGRPLVDERGAMFERVAPARASTFYVKAGDAPLASIFSLLILGMILIQYKAHHEKRRTLSV
ncbi:MAG: apolipoprotein N-acyltransferase [Kiritimatiellae bacterium]|nr:apolipoprotein N-acyltransferase [Kiritimatiellia bacterium]